MAAREEREREEQHERIYGDEKMAPAVKGFLGKGGN